MPGMSQATTLEVSKTNSTRNYMTLFYPRWRRLDIRIEILDPVKDFNIGINLTSF